MNTWEAIRYSAVVHRVCAYLGNNLISRVLGGVNTLITGYWVVLLPSPSQQILFLEGSEEVLANQTVINAQLFQNPLYTTDWARVNLHTPPPFYHIPDLSNSLIYSHHTLPPNNCTS